MQLNKKQNKPDIKRSSSTLFDDDFASGFEDSKFDKFKPLFNVLIVVTVLILIAWGFSVYLAGSDSNDNLDQSYSSSAAQSDEDVDTKLAQCISDVATKNPTPETTDSNFYPKLISGYDAQLDCYDQYPDADGMVSRSSIEYARESAIDSSGSYKDTYLSTNTYEYKPSTSSGSSRNSSSSATGGDSDTTSKDNQAPSSSGSQPSVDMQWCAAKKAELDNLYLSYQEARSEVQAIDTQLRKISTARPSGFTGTQSQLDAWRSSERQRLSVERTALITQQDSANATYNAAQSEYRSRSCY